MKLQERVELTTPVTGTKVVLRGYITGRIKQEVTDLLLSDAEFTTDAEGKSSPVRFTNSSITKANNRAIELIVLEVGERSDVLDAVLDLPEADYEAVKAKVDEIQRPLVNQTETGSQPITTES
jgi:hypothetical protein